MVLTVQEGAQAPFGATWTTTGVNFSILAENASEVTLNLYIVKDQTIVVPLKSIPFNPDDHKSGSTWSVHLLGIPDKLLYTYTIDDRRDLLDPYARQVWTPNSWSEGPYKPYGYAEKKPHFDWEGVKKPLIPLSNLIIYEAHLRGFTKDSSSSVKHPGTYLGMVEKIHYLKELGINAVELLPVMEFNECSEMRTFLPTKNTLLNYWGYSPVNFFSPMQRYAAGKSPGDASLEFKTLVKELHREGIEVILDVVFNHTSEGGPNGPTHSFRGFAPGSFYMHGDYTGCGNTFNANSPEGVKIIISALKHWAMEYQIDGFRFDLASALTRAADGTPLESPPLITAINDEPLLSTCKMIAEPWDAAGLYHVGCFPEAKNLWAEWNGQYRDTIRRHLQNREENLELVKRRLEGSNDLYHERGTDKSINFITCHDGFTLKDLFSYSQKHNFDNGEENRDGSNCNESGNCGIEGETLDPIIIQKREALQEKAFQLLLSSKGVPLIRMGDEYGHTSHGNNNTWCQDNKLSWFDWSRAPFSYVKEYIATRKKQNYF